MPGTGVSALFYTASVKIIALSDTLYRLSFGFVSAFLIVDSDELILVDTGPSGQAEAILEGIESAGLVPGHLKHILVTQLHSDHVGSLADLKAATGARVYAHRDEAPAIEEGRTLRQSQAAPTMMSRLMVKLMINPRRNKLIPGTSVDEKLNDGQVLNLAGGIQAIHTPGHTAGHLCYLWKTGGGVLFAGDVAGGGAKLKYPMLFENPDEGTRSIEKLAALDFETAHFCHGRSILRGASGVFAEGWG